MRNKNLITGAILIILGSAFLFIAVNIFDGHLAYFDAEHVPQENINPQPHIKNDTVVRIPFARRINPLFLNAPRRASPYYHYA